MAGSPQPSYRGGRSLPIRAAKSAAQAQTPTWKRLSDDGLMQWAKDLRKEETKKNLLPICRKSELSESSEVLRSRLGHVCGCLQKGEFQVK